MELSRVNGDKWFLEISEVTLSNLQMQDGNNSWEGQNIPNGNLKFSPARTSGNSVLWEK